MVRLLSALLAVFAAHAAVASPLTAQVDELFHGRRYADAQILLEKATAAEPENAEAWSALGRVFLQLNHPERAVAALEKATALAPQHSDYQRWLGDAYGLSALRAGLFSKLGFARKSKTAYDRAVALDPRSVPARMSLMDFCRQAPSMVGGGLDKAYEQARAIQQLDADRGRIALATLYVGEKRFTEAFALFDEALAVNASDYAALYQTGRLSAMTGERLDQGLSNLRKCLTLSQPEGQPGPAQVHWRIGGILERRGDKSGARAAYEAAVEADPRFVQAIEALRKINQG